MAKPDDRSDNVEHLQRHINHTMGNIREARDFLKAHEDDLPDEERAAIEAKNARREASLRGFREEIQDEANHQATD